MRHDVLDIEHRRERNAGALAVVDRHRAVGAFGHDLHSRARGGGNLHPDEPQAEIPQDRRCDATDPEAEAGVLDKARFVQSLDGLRGVKMRRFGHWSFRQ